MPPLHLLPAWLANATFTPLAVAGGPEQPQAQPLVDAHPPHKPPKAQFFLGPPGPGAPFHFHKDAVNYLAHGAKLWWLLPPSQALYSTIPMAQWVAEGALQPLPHAARPLAEPLHYYLALQQEGDAVYIPAGWGHAVLNLQTSVGFALEWGTQLQVPV